MNLLIVCTGNTCRSPMAEKILQKKANEYNLDINILSAGISAIEGYAASKNARKIIKEYGLDDEHSSRRSSKQLLEWADIIFTMTADHKRILLQQEPHLHNKIFTLKELVITEYNSNDILEPSIDINDPFAQDLEVYRSVAQEIDDALEKLVKLNFFKKNNN